MPTVALLLMRSTALVRAADACVRAQCATADGHPLGEVQGSGSFCRCLGTRLTALALPLLPGDNRSRGALGAPGPAATPARNVQVSLWRKRQCNSSSGKSSPTRDSVRGSSTG